MNDKQRLRDVRRLAMQVLYQIDLTTPVAAEPPRRAPGSAQVAAAVARRGLAGGAPAATSTAAAVEAGAGPDRASILQGLDPEHDPPHVREQAVDLALGAWRAREQADATIAELAPDWPTHRQPPVDRAVLRLAAYEMATGRTPVKVAINEAIELAKTFGSEHSPSFVNGVLDKIARQRPSPAEPPG